MLKNKLKNWLLQQYGKLQANPPAEIFILMPWLSGE